ncbi:MAG TPA: TlpA disulfide reductase family protein [Novosphingobium sp.]|nr:TlpA disulfide reductase family protein [Novosphingobium sp.]
MSLSLTLAVPGIALSIGGCDRQSEPPAQPAADTPGKQGAASAVDRSHAGSAMPDFTLAGPAGRKLRLPDLKGTPVLLNLWATWCAPCVAELPALDKLAESQAGKLKVLTVNQDSGAPEKAGAFLKQRGVTRLEPWLDPKGDLAFHYEAPSLPMTVLYDAAGREVWRIAGPREWGDAETAKLIAEAQ